MLYYTISSAKMQVPKSTFYLRQHRATQPYGLGVHTLAASPSYCTKSLCLMQALQSKTTQFACKRTSPQRRRFHTIWRKICLLICTDCPVRCCLKFAVLWEFAWIHLKNLSSALCRCRAPSVQYTQIWQTYLRTGNTVFLLTIYLLCGKIT